MKSDLWITALAEVSDPAVDCCAFGPSDEGEIVHRRKPKVNPSHKNWFLCVCVKYFGLCLKNIKNLSVHLRQECWGCVRTLRTVSQACLGVRSTLVNSATTASPDLHT